jgi:hypothetical protein
VTTIAWSGLLLIGGWAAGLLAPTAWADVAATPEPSPSPEPKLEVQATVDVSYAWNANRPPQGDDWFAGVGTSAKRGNEFALNLGLVDLTLPTSEASPVGFRLALGFGNGMDVLRSGEIARPGTNARVWHHVVQASAQWETGLGRGLRLEAGVYPSHIGMETFTTRDNWNYTRSWLGELSPFTQTGLKLAYPFSERWSGQLHVLNGWQGIADNNNGKSVGAQLAYSRERFAISWNAVAGPEQADNDDDVRVLGDVVVTWRANPDWSMGLAVDAAREGRGAAEAARWWGAGVYARWAPPASRTAIAVRAERFDDEDGAISGHAQTLHEITLTLEHRPDPRLVFKLEARRDASTAEVFSARDGAEKSQFLLLFGAVASF